MPVRKRRADPAIAGFTLIEILVAFTVATLVLAAIYQMLSTGLNAKSTSQRFSEAVLLAQSSLDALTGAAISPGETSDRIGAYLRQTTIQPRPDLLPASAQLDVVPYEIAVEIDWREGVRRRAVSLSTLWLGPVR
jgi:general secretion pathway protein I